MKVIKRNGTEVDFDKSKIIIAIQKAKKDTPSSNISDATIEEIADYIEFKCSKYDRSIDIEEIQDMVENSIMSKGEFELARNYVRYRYQRSLNRNVSSLDERVMNLIGNTNEVLTQENANKNPMINATQRDYMAGEISKDLCRKYIFSDKVNKAHDEGIIHVHDRDYAIMKDFNCCLVNLEDMLQNGTVITKTKIDTPHSFSTACNVATQIIAQIASNQYGGQTITLSHLAPFVDVSRKKIAKELEEELSGLDISEEKKKEIVESRVKKDITRGVQTIQYQILTLMTTNGQTPFVSVAMYLGECKDERTKKDLAMVIEEVLNQRIQGIKNEKGAWITPVFPKLLYILEEDNIHEDSPYWYLTELAAKCTAKRMVPDYISEKVMKELKNGQAFPCMGAVQGDNVITYKLNGKLYVESFKRAWDRVFKFYNNNIQISPVSSYIPTPGLFIWDSASNGFVEVKKFTRNNDMGRWYRLNMEGRTILVTEDHPLPTQRGRIKASELVPGDMIPKITNQYSEISNCNVSDTLAWLLGIMICDGSYSRGSIICCFGLDEYDIVSKVRAAFMSEFGLETKLVERHRGERGNYYEIRAYSPNIANYFLNMFEGLNKVDRHIPAAVFSDFPMSAKIAFLAGMIDADGYVRRTRSNQINIGSTNLELAIQQMLLANIIGLNAQIRPNWYKGKQYPDKIRYAVSIGMSKSLEYDIACRKKVDYNKKFILHHANKYSEITSIEFLGYCGEYEYDVETASDKFDVSGINSHNCRSFLSDYVDPETGKHKFYGRFNLGVVTLNLVDVALSSGRDMNKFWELMEERSQLIFDAHMSRINYLKGTTSDCSPIHWQYGGIARLKPGEKIDKLFYNGYSTVSYGYAGLYECVKYMTGKSHTDPEATPFAKQVLQFINDKCNQWKEETKLGFSVYGSPIENSTYRFAKSLQRRFGKIEGITDKNYVTNSFHVNVTEKIDAFSKLKFESQFQELSSGGNISYIECPDMQKNIPAVLKVIQYIYDNTMYAELNSKSDYCMECGYDGEVEMKKDESGKLYWQCPNCGNTDLNRMSIVRRVCGYLSSNTANQGRMADIHDRVLHL